MLKFRQWLNEKWSETFHNTAFGDKRQVDLYTNPSHKELSDITHHHETRAMLHDGKFYAWHPEMAFHEHVKIRLGHHEQHAWDITLNHDKKEMRIHNVPARKDDKAMADLDSNSYVKSKLGQYKRHIE